jgi:ribosome-binding protein aMBF1 (putative translation factor)
LRNNVPKPPTRLANAHRVGTGAAALARAPLRSYTELIEILQSLPLLVRETRRARGLNLRDAADEIGFSFNTLSRFERGQHDLQLSNVVMLLRWLDSSARSTA